METILKTGYWKILSLFYKDKSVRLHLREIARRAGLNENSVTRFLKELEDSKILKSEKEGNLKKYFVVKSAKVYTIFQIMDLEKFEKLLSLRKRSIDYFLFKLSEQPVIVLLFGSTARETSSKDSDIDLLLIVNKKIETKEAEKYSESQTGIRISTFQITYEVFLKELKLKEDHVIQSALDTGYPIMNHLKFYQTINNGNE